MTWTKPADKLNVTLNRPSYKSIFINNQAEFECRITTHDETAVPETNVTWMIDGKTMVGTCKPTESDGKMKVCTLAAQRSDWKLHSEVSCSVNGDNMEPITKSLTVHRGDEASPEVTVHIPSEDSQSEVTLVCLVSGKKKKDYYIAWTEDEGQQTGNYKAGTELLRENDNGDFMVASVYKTTRENWKKKMFSCHVWPFGNNKPMGLVSVSSKMNNSVECRK